MIVDAEQAAIRDYLAPIDVQSLYHSCLDAALRDTRGAALRHPPDGSPCDLANHSRSWLGTVGYLIIVDQLGSALKPASEPEGTFSSETTSFERCLRRFSPECSTQTISALYGLRCALAHDFGLINPPQEGRRLRLQHRLYALTPASIELVTSPVPPWDGKLDPLPAPSSATTVNTRQLADLVEAMVASLRAGPIDSLRIALTGGVQELRLRFFFSARLS